jgi:PAS domain-containing protein
MRQLQEKPNSRVKASAAGHEDTVFVPESLGVAFALGASCWLLDAFLTTSLTGASVQTALLPSGEALALRSAVAILVAVAAAITSSFLIRELRIRREEREPAAPQSVSELLDSFSDSAFAVNERGEIIDANQAAAKLFSWPVKMFMPMKLDWLISEYIDEKYAGSSSFAEILGRDSQCCNGGSIAVIGKALSGQKFVAELSCMPSRDDDRRYIVFIRERVGHREADGQVTSVAA